MHKLIKLYQTFLFEEIKLQDLVFGKKYKIVTHYGEFYGNYYYDNTTYNYIAFTDTLLYFFGKEIKETTSFSFPRYSLFYKIILQKEKIQQNMENRALSKVLKKITGDDFFTW
jgi:hypothetical protein